MRCKQGDLAIIVSVNMPKFTGRIVKVVAPSEFWVSAWQTKPEIVDPDDGMSIDWKDSALRPIRPSEGQDETIQLAGKSQGVTA